MSSRRILIAALLGGLALGCPSEPTTEPTPTPTPAVAGPLQAASMRARLPVPLGIGTAGFNGIGVGDSPTPYAVLFPGTTRLHSHPDMRIVTLSRGAGFELIFVRLDLVAAVQQLREGVLAELRTRTGRDFDDALVIGATHTHSGPGRIIDGELFRLIADRFFPQFYERLIDSIADGIEQTLNELAPARLGTTLIEPESGHSDRRCEDGVSYQNDSLPLFAVEQEGEITALVGSYALHGTILGMEELTLSQDVSGAIEEQLALRFDRPVTTVLFNSWGGDMAPSNPPGGAPSAPMPEDYARMERIGQGLADAVEEALPSMDWHDEPVIEGHTGRYPINREAIGYAEGEFPYPHGGVYCSSSESTCDEVLDIDGLDQACIPFPEDSPAPMTSVTTVGRLGPFHLVTFAGEVVTELAEQVMEGMQSHDGVGDIFFVGYGNDYLGYALTEEDWWHGGYEASGSMWGPRQGTHMAAATLEIFDRYQTGAALSFEEPAPAEPFDTTADPFEPEDSEQVGTWLEPPEASYEALDTVEFSIAGADPWWGAPLVRLQRDEGAGFVDVLRADGQPLDSDGYAFWADLVPAPSYDEERSAASRVFEWRFSHPLTRAVSGPLPAGQYRYLVLLPQPDGTVQEVESSPFEVL